MLSIYVRDMKRGAIQKTFCKAVLIHIPFPLADRIDSAVLIEDSDRSKFIRNAIREKLEKHGLGVAAGGNER